MGQPQWDRREVHSFYLPAILQGLEGEVRTCVLQQSRPFSSRRVPLVLVNKGKKKSSFRKARGPEKMGALDKNLCNFWKGVASCNVVLPTSSIISYEFHEGQLDVHIGSSLGFLNLHLYRPTFVSCVVLAFPVCCLSLLIFLCIVNH